MKRKSNDNDDQSSKKAKVNDEDENNQAVPTNPRFEWYDEIKRALSKATDQTLSLEALRKKVSDVEKVTESSVYLCRFLSDTRN